MRGISQAWQAAVRFVRRWPAPANIPNDWNVEQHARYLVQKIARENAAAHAVHVASSLYGEYRNAERVSTPVRTETLSRLMARHQEARKLRDYAVVDLRLALGLPEHPTQAEVGHWGEAP